MKSVSQMAEQCEGLIDTSDVTPWENEFLKSVVEKEAERPGYLSAPTVEKLKQIYDKHFV